MRIRRVVTGQAPDGTSVFVGDQEVAPITLDLLRGIAFHRIWGADEAVRLPTDGSVPAAPAYFPPAGGFCFGFLTLGPDTRTIRDDLDVEAALAELAEKLPGLAEVMEPENPGMHTTDTVDFDVVLAGEVWLELDNGAEVHLKAGDCVVQNGTRHAWRNKPSEPCIIIATSVGVHREA